MSTKTIRQTAFNAGEVDQIFFRRTDLPGYLRGAQSMLNMEVAFSGLAKKRRPTEQQIVIATGTEQARLFPLRDKDGIYYILYATNTNIAVYSASTNTFIQNVTMPYMSADLRKLGYDTDTETITFVNSLYPQARVYISNYSPLTFTYQVFTIYPQPAYDFNDINYNAFAVTLSVVGNVLTFQFTGLGSDPGFTSAWIGGSIIGGGLTAEQPLGYALITAVSYAAGTVTFTGTVMQPFATANYAPLGSGYSIRQPVFTAALGYPSVVTYYQNRLFYGNTPSLQNTLFGSQIGSFNNFDIGVGQDTEALIYDIGQDDAGGIVALNGGKQLEIFTENYEFAAPQNQDAGLTPASFSIRQQSSFGSSGLCIPQNYLNDTYIVSKGGTSIINYHFNGVGLSYTATNVSITSTHLVKNPISASLQRSDDASQDNFIYFLNSDNTVTSFQFNSEFKDQSVPVAALTPIEFAQDVVIVDTLSLDNQIYFLKYFPNTQQSTIETFTNNDVKLDSIIEATLTNNVVTGLDVFNGLSVNVVYNYIDLGTYEVTNGEVTVDNPDGYSGAVLVGILYDVELIPLPFYAGNVATDMFKSITTIYTEYYNSLNFYINGNLVPYLTYYNIQNSIPVSPQTGVSINYPTLGYNRTSSFTITQSSPYDLQIVGISYQLIPTVI